MSRLRGTRWVRHKVNVAESPMLRLLRDCNVNGMIQVEYAQQWPTLIKAQRLGYVDDKQFITEPGKAWLAHNS